MSRFGTRLTAGPVILTGQITGGGSGYTVRLQEADPIVADLAVIRGTGKMFILTLTGDHTINFVNGVDGQPVVLLVTQGGAGGHVLTLGAMCNWPADGSYTPSSGAGDKDLLGGIWDGLMSKLNMIPPQCGY